ncbi:hypothetical protein RHGRI_006875 [Rhododendron griersonianum]|uniref:Pre-rRNA-processing protein Ipi1 N-terminal domain-containing protein n=1 Tax=Rhododendron griersonianum TaxID=479676 RepID=A0AAV6KV83_9ERIC|nr:hypothetical protein RHGRI_006875 [Rhododendron griersonianum]
MVKTKGPPRKKQQRGVDFKKIKRKIGRKLPPPKNATNTEIKSKAAIILPEQSVASEKAGLAVSRKGLTLKELLQQTSHHNSKVRKDALTGIRDIFLKHPAELRLHKLAVIEKLRERISDDDKLVRETLYQLLKAVIFPSCREDSQGPFVSLMMAYIFNAMTHLAIDVRLMAFNFFDLVVQHYPSSFSTHAEKIFKNYEDILQKNQFYLQDKGKLKTALAGLVHCLLLLPSIKGDHGSSRETVVAAQGILHAFEPEAPKDPAGFSVIHKKLKDLMPVLVSCFEDFIRLAHTMTQLDPQSFDCMLSILKCIDLVVKFFADGISDCQQELQVSMPSCEGLAATIQGQTIMPSFLKKLFDLFPLNLTYHLSGKDDDKYFILNILITEIFLRSIDWKCSPVALLEKFLEFFTTALSEETLVGGVHVYSLKTVTSGDTWRYFVYIVCAQWNLNDLDSSIPNPLTLEDVDKQKQKECERSRGAYPIRVTMVFVNMQAFTKIFRSCNLESSVKWACLSAIEEMLFPRQGLKYLDARDQEVLDYQIAWIRELPLLLIMLGNKNPLRSRSVLSLLLRLGQCAVSNTLFAQEYDNMQYSLAEFYCTCMDERNVSYGPFVSLDRGSQELSICCLYYFSVVDSLLLKSLAWSCLYDDLEPSVIFRIIEVLHSAYKVGHIQIADLISFFITLLSCFKVTDKGCPILESDEISNRGSFRSVTTVVCSCLLQMGDDFLVFQMLETVVVDQIVQLQRPGLDNICALFRVLVALDCRPTRLSQQSILTLSNFLPGYLIDVVTSSEEINMAIAERHNIQSAVDRLKALVGKCTDNNYLMVLSVLFPCFHFSHLCCVVRIEQMRNGMRGPREQVQEKY